MFEKKVLNMRTIDEWKALNKKVYTPMRDKAKICVIDDDGIAEKSLRASGYTSIRLMQEYNDIEDVKPYNVILCDIKGIGDNIDPKKQGIAVALDIKKMYPDKIVIQFSGENPREFDIDFMYNNMRIDGFIQKGESSKKLLDQLDEYCSILWNPIKAWEFAEKNLRREGVSNKLIAYLEDAYVRSLDSKKNYVLLYKERISGAKILDLAISMFNFLSQVLVFINNAS